jgi:hypothetical protein
MVFKRTAAVAAMAAIAGGVVAGSAASQSQVVTGPIADYWVSAATTSGMMGAMSGGGRPSMGSIMGAMAGRGGGANHTLNLQLGSTQAATGAPQADHLPPGGLGAGPALPLVSPEKYVPHYSDEPSDPRPPNMRKPEGKILIYWGCGEKVGPGQPVVIDFAKIGQGQFPRMQTIEVRSEHPPGPDRYKSYGEWPNSRSRTTVPPTGSLVGPHTVKGNYSPQINFSLGPNQDFLAPLNVSQGPSAMGGTRLNWPMVPQSTGYYAWMLGTGGGGGRGEGGMTMVMWSSSTAQSFMGALMDYISPSEARRLVASGAVMSPQTTSCVIPAEVAKASPTGLLSMIAYGDEVNFVDPPRPSSLRTPWNVSWRAKVRYKSTYGSILGMGDMGMGRGASDDDDAPRRGGGSSDDDAPQRGGGRGSYQQPQPQQPPPSAAGAAGRAIGGALLRRGLPF